MSLRRYRVSINTAGLRAGETVELDPEHPGWAPYLPWLEPLDDDEPDVAADA